MLGKLFNSFFPMREFLKYLFKKTLGDYILNDLDLNKIEIEISNKAFISLQNIDLNASEINKKHFENFPFIILEGKIKKFELSFSFDKISINIDKLNILLMPVFNKEKSKNLISKKQIPIKINNSSVNSNYNDNHEKKDSKNDSRKDYSSTTIKENKDNEFSLVSSFLNSALNNLEINITNISVNILSFEGSNTFQDNPRLIFFISEICFRKKNEEDIKIIKENNNFQSINNKIKNTNFEKENNLTKNNSSDINIFNKTDNNLKNGDNYKNKNNIENNFNFQTKEKKENFNSENSLKNQLSFLHNKILLVDKIILRIHQQNQNIDNEFFEMTNENEEKINFNFFCNNCSILAFDYKTTGYSILLNFEEIFNSNYIKKNKSDENIDFLSNIMEINLDIRKLEICLNPLQFQILMNYFDVFKIISLIKEKNFQELRFKQEAKNNNFYKFKTDDNIKNIKPFKILNTIINKFYLNIFFGGMNIIFLESNYMRDLPKLWSFYQENYNKKIENIYSIESHFSYLEDNYFLAYFGKLKISYCQDLFQNENSFEIYLEKIFLKYVEYLGKRKIIPFNNVANCKLTFNNSNFVNNISTNENNMNTNLFNSKILFHSQMNKSKIIKENNNKNLKSKIHNSNINNNSIYASNIYFMDKSMNRSNCSLYESVRDYEEVSQNDSFLMRNSLNNTIYQSTLDSKDALLERYNLIFESEYLHESHLIIELANNSITENVCLVIKGFTNFFPNKENGKILNCNPKNQLIIDKEKELEDRNLNFNDDHFAEFFKFYLDIVFKKIVFNFKVVYLFKITKLIYFTQIILNEFLFLIDDKGILNNPIDNKSKTIKSNNNLPYCYKESGNSVSFLDKSIYGDDYQKINNIQFNCNIESNSNINTSKYNNSYDNSKISINNYDCRNNHIIYRRGCYNKVTQILIHLEEANLKLHTLKKDFYDMNGNCKTNLNSNLNQEFKKYEEFANFYFNSKFLSEYLINYFKLNLCPFISDIKKNEYNINLIGKNQEIKLDKPINHFYFNKEFLEVNLTNHRILINLDNHKNERIFDFKKNLTNFSVVNKLIMNEKQSSIFYLNSVDKILYDFETIQINFGKYNILKVKRDELKCFKNNSINDISNLSIKKNINEYEKSYNKHEFNTTNNINNNTNIYKRYTNNVEEMISKNNFYFKSSPLIINRKKTFYLEDSNDEELNSAFRDKFIKAEQKMHNKIQSIYSNHNLNLYQNLHFNNSNYFENKDEDPLFNSKIIENFEMKINLFEDIFITLEPQQIKKLIPFIDSVLFTFNIHKILENKQREIFNFYKQIFFVSLNIDNFEDFNFYFNKNYIKVDEIKSESFIEDKKEYNSKITINKFNNININLSNIVLIVLKNESDDYINFAYKEKNYTNYLLKMIISNLHINLFDKGKNNLNILISMNDIILSFLKSKNKEDYFFEEEEEIYDKKKNNFKINENRFNNNRILNEISYDENLFLFKGDTYYMNINCIKDDNKICNNHDPEKDLDKYFKNINHLEKKNILTLVINKKEIPKDKIQNLSNFQNIKNNKNNEHNKNETNEIFNEIDRENKKSLIIDQNLEESENKYFKKNENISINEKNDHIISNNTYKNLLYFEGIIQENLIPQSDTNLDIIIISNDPVLSPLFHLNFTFEEIKIIAKEFGFCKLDQIDCDLLNEKISKNKRDIKLNEYCKIKRPESNSICITDFKYSDINNVNIDLKHGMKETSTEFEINLENNIENIINQENMNLDIEKDLSNLNLLEDEKNKFNLENSKNGDDVKSKNKIIERNSRLITLFETFNSNIDFKIEVNRLSIDIFIQENGDLSIDKDPKNKINLKSQSIYNIENKKIIQKIDRKKQIRAILHIEKITLFNDIDILSSNDNKNLHLTKRNLLVKNLSLFLLKDLDHPYAGLNILKLNNGRFYEDSILKYLGFVEILNSNFINLSYSKEMNLNFFKNKEIKNENKRKDDFLDSNLINDINIKIGDICLYLCKDSLDACFNIAEGFKERFNKIKDLFFNEEENVSRKKSFMTNSDDYIDDKKNNTERQINSDNIICSKDFNIKDKIKNNIEIVSKNPLNINCSILECPKEINSEKRNIKNLVLVDDYCNYPLNVKQDNWESEYEKLEREKNKINITNKKINTKNYDKNNIIFSNRENIDRKEETIILFMLDSFKIYIYKGNDFNFIEEDYNNIYDSFLSENKNIFAYENNHNEIFMIFTNSINLKNEEILNKKEPTELYSFFYNEDNFSIKIDNKFFKKNLSSSIILNELQNINEKNFLKNNKNINNNENNIKLNKETIENFTSINNKIAKSIETQSIFDKANFQLIEKFYFCQDKNKINKQINEKNKFNYLNLEKKLLRKKKNIRDYNNHICINIEILKTKLTFFKNNEKIKINIYLNKFDIEDYVKNSKYKRIISKYSMENFYYSDIYENSKKSKKIQKYKLKQDRPLLDLDIDIIKINQSFKTGKIKKSSFDSSDTYSYNKIRKDLDFKDEENIDSIDILDLNSTNNKLENDLIYIDGFISPINILIDQTTLLFIFEFFLENENKNEMINKINIPKKNINYKKIKDPLDIKIKVEKLKNSKKKNNIHGKIIFIFFKFFR